jgi:hypothetical protein
MTKRREKITWENMDEERLEKLHAEIYALIEKRCERDCDGDLPVRFMLNAYKLHYPFNDCFLISNRDKDIDEAIDLQTTNVSSAFDRLKTLFSLKKLLTREKK